MGLDCVYAMGKCTVSYGAVYKQMMCAVCENAATIAQETMQRGKKMQDNNTMERMQNI